MAWLALAAAMLAGAGVVQALAGWLAAARFAGRPVAPRGARPPCSVLKPLHGDEPLLEAALASICTQDYPCFQLVCGVQDPADPAIAAVRRLQGRFPAADIALVVDPRQHGLNRKIGNLMNMLPVARHDLLVIADSDVHAAPGYLVALADTLDLPQAGLATTVYAGLSGVPGLAARLGATAITHGFLPGALLSRLLGRQDSLGATMALRRQTLAAVGGLAALVNHLADDNVLGRLVRSRGLKVLLAPTVCATTVPECTLGALFRHELRWARTIRRLVPAAFAASAIQHPLAWALLALLLSGGAGWAWAVLGLAWIGRAAAARGIDARLGLPKSGLATAAPIWLLPLRDLLSVAVIASSYASDRVEWRGQVLHTALDKPVDETRSDAADPDRSATAAIGGPTR